jgi:hypothetical protein
MEHSKSYSRSSKSDIDSSDRPEKSHDAIVQKELKSLFQTGKSNLSYADIVRLRNTYSDEKILDEIYEAYQQQYNQVRKQAKKFAEFILEKYGKERMPMHKIIQKSLKYKKSAKLSDAAYEEFQRLVEAYLGGELPSHSMPRTVIGRTLGAIPAEMVASEGGLVLAENEYGVLDEILRQNAAMKPLHSNIQLQALFYRDCAPEALKGTFDHSKHNPASHVHPVLTAMFLPKIASFEERMLYADLSQIIKDKHEKKQFRTRPNVEFYVALATDPNDVVCDVASPMADLRKRVQLQSKIWENVLNLRNGQYYKNNLNDFLMTVENCRLNIYDMPDLMYIKDDGAVMRRLLAAFAIRPTVVVTTPLIGSINIGMYDRSITVPKVRHVSMIPVRLPVATAANQDVPYNLNESLEQAQLYIEGNTLVPRAQQVFYSNDVLIFYVNRRYHGMNIARYTDPFNFQNLPLTIGSLEQFNNRYVDFSTNVQIGAENFKLRSVIASERVPVTPNVTVLAGSTALIMKHPDAMSGLHETVQYLYDPWQSGQIFKNEATGEYIHNEPITYLPMESSGNPESFTERASRRGIIFIYQKSA